jgi:hypothetical protein
MADEWLREQGIVEEREVNTDRDECDEILVGVARCYSIRLAFLQAIWELIAAGSIVPSGSEQWHPSLSYVTPRYQGGIQLPSLTIPHPTRITRLPGRAEPADTDIFLEGISTASLHPGIIEAIEQSLACFTPVYRRFLAVLKQARLNAGLTQVDVAKRIGRPQSFVSNFESGERRIDVAEFLFLCRVYNVDPRSLIESIQRN